MDPEARILGCAEEVDRVVRAVLGIDIDDKARDVGQVLDKLRGAA
jgi:hypothetical protein